MAEGWNGYERFLSGLVASKNPHLAETVRSARPELGIPPQGFESQELAALWQERQRGREALKGPTKEPVQAGDERLLRFLRGMLAGEALDPRLPVDAWVLETVDRFHLPPWIAPWIKRFLSLGDQAGPATWPKEYTEREMKRRFYPLMSQGLRKWGERGGLGLRLPPYPRELVPLDPERRYWACIITGLTESTTADEWASLWESLRSYIQYQNPRRPANKRLINDLATLRRGLYMWDLVRVRKLSYQRALDAFQNDTGQIADDRQLRRALRRVDRLMKPEAASGKVSNPLPGESRVMSERGAPGRGRTLKLPIGTPPIRGPQNR